MKRRTFIAGVGASSIGTSALVGTGAFSRVESDRAVTVQVAEDPDAYLGLDKCDAPNGSYAHLDENGHLAIYMDPENPTRDDTPLGAGVNSNSTTWFHNVFRICNQGKEEACVWIEDDADWPYYDDERRIDFYLGADDEASIIGQENARSLEVGDCVCIGIKTRTYELADGDRLLESLDDRITLVADVDGTCAESPACTTLYGRYECTTYEEENGSYRRTGSAYRIGNDASGSGGATTYDLAIADSPGEFRSNLELEANTSQRRIGDASVPLGGLLFWDAGDACSPLARTWGRYKSDHGLDDLTDWYGTVGNGVPADAPSDVDDDLLVVTVEDVPAEAEPDVTIPSDQFPEMSDAASDAGWTTCDE